MAKYVTHKSTREGKRETIARNAARAVKRGATTTTRGGHARTSSERAS